MIIKSLSIKEKRFKQLFNYINKEAEKGSIFTSNLLVNKNITEQFFENAKLVPERKNGVYMYHEILSFHKDEVEISNEILQDLLSDWVELRAPKNLIYGAVHREKDHTHIHLMISSNGLNEKKKLRLTKNQFKKIKLELEKKQIEKYPHLRKSICQDLTQKRNISRKFGDLKAQKGKNKLTEREQIQNLINQAIKSPNFKEFFKSQNIEPYKRGKNDGVLFQGKKYRFKTLGFEPKIEQIFQPKEKVAEKEKTKEYDIDEDLKAFQDFQKGDEKDRDKGIDFEI